MIWPQRSVPTPKNVHQSHWSAVSPFVENALLPNSMMTICGRENNKKKKMNCQIDNPFHTLQENLDQ